MPLTFYAKNVIAKILSFCCTFFEIYDLRMFFFANLHINVKYKTTKLLLHKCLPLSCSNFLYSRFFSTHEDLLVYPSLYLSRFIRIVAGKVKPGWMQDYHKCIFCPWIQYNLYNITKGRLPFTFISFQQDKNKHFWDYVSGIDKNVIEHAVGDILIFLFRYNVWKCSDSHFFFLSYKYSMSSDKVLKTLIDFRVSHLWFLFHCRNLMIDYWIIMF